MPGIACIGGASLGGNDPIMTAFNTAAADDWIIRWGRRRRFR